LAPERKGKKEQHTRAIQHNSIAQLLLTTVITATTASLTAMIDV